MLVKTSAKGKNQNVAAYKSVTLSQPQNAPTVSMLDSFHTLVYKRVDGLEISLDLYPPSNNTSRAVPLFVYFHGGGLTVGNKASYLPLWLLGMLFATALRLDSLMDCSY